MSKTINSTYRILDANLNRLREALRVIEEYYRFIKNDMNLSVSLKQLRHSLIEMEDGFGKDMLLFNRDTDMDCFADINRPEEMQRESETEVLCAGFKRAQEAARVIEEYAKITEHPSLSQNAKMIRFSLYKLEKQFLDS